MKKRNRFFHAPRVPHEGRPRSVPKGKFIWHNHIEHFIDMWHGLNGFRYWNGLLPIDYRQFERCHCGWAGLPHYKRRGLGSGKCVSIEQVLRNAGLSPKDIKALATDRVRPA
jgi:hypothetical protein